MTKYAILALTLLASACNSGEEITTSQRIEQAAVIFEYTPAPGQFINEAKSGYDRVTTPEAACAYAAKRLAAGDYVSLGGWGGYLVAGFAEPVLPANGYELLVAGNPLVSSSEPGVVWVMEDLNNNGRPDDGVWYELRGSEYANAKTIHNYSITYTRPIADNAPVSWRDSEGASGTIERMNEHTQPSYFPLWITGEELTFSGVRLPDNVGTGTADGVPAWIPAAFGWGYADNYSAVDMAKGYNRFNIADAVTADGQPAHLSRVDFVKVQSGINAKAPLIGEISTEVCRIACIRIIRN